MAKTKEAVLLGMLNGEEVELHPRTSGEQVVLAEGVNASAKIAELVQAVNLRPKTEDVQKMIDDSAICGSEVGLVEILPECELFAIDPETPTGEFYVLQEMGEVVVGNTYTVTYNGTDYVLTAQAFEMEGLTGSYLGDMGILTGEPTGSAPFGMACLPPATVAQAGGVYALFMDPTVPASGTLRIQYEGEVIRYIDPKYIKDMYGEGEVETVAGPAMLTFEAGTALVASTVPPDVAPGSTYTVTWETDAGSSEYTCVAQPGSALGSTSSAQAVLGNLRMYGIQSLPDTGEPFCIMIFTADTAAQAGAAWGVVCGDGSTEATVTIKTDGVRKVPAKYLPAFVTPSDTAALQEHVAELDDRVGTVRADITTTSSIVTRHTNEISTLERRASALESQVKTMGDTSALEERIEANETAIAALQKNGTGGGASGDGLPLVAGGNLGSIRGIGAAAEDTLYAMGPYSAAEGYLTKASGVNSHAEGRKSEATGDSAHAEGQGTVASNNNAHAEGQNTTASGIGSHAEGYGTTASGSHSHAEGYGTVAAASEQHVQGRYNVPDPAGDYVHIVGAGTASEPKNIHTLTPTGDAYFAGGLTLGGTVIYLKSSTRGSSKEFAIMVDDNGNLRAYEVEQ